MLRSNRHDKKLSKCLRALTPGQLAEMISSLPDEDIEKIHRKLHLKRKLDGSEESATKLRTMLLMSTGKGWLTEFAEIVTCGPRATAMRVLGDKFANPDEEETRQAILSVLHQYGSALTGLWVALMLSHEARATPHIVRVCSEIAELDAFVSGDTPTRVNSPAIATQERERKDRSAQRSVKREQRRKKREADERSRSNNKRDARKSALVAPAMGDDPSPPPTADNAETTKMCFPHLSRWPKADPHHELVGSVVNAYVPFTTSDDDGKVRPAVVLAVASRYLIVKPLYSKPRFGAGHWRAVEILDWRDAGLHHESWAGDEVHRVRTASAPYGRLSLTDWNRVCRGEVNNA